ncbi:MULTISPECIES: hypothetical protein [Polymorphospora]|uniref:Uncharacterized protein n=1 Tax=Polymorphospora lycopeni TaxID=3140240 RepID=A0ABV5CW37_9ACTN
MATVTLIRANPVFQAYGEAAWNVVAGDRDNYFGWSVRPFQARDSALLTGVAAHSDNNLNQSTDLIVRLSPNQGPVGSGGLIRITGVMVR